MHTLPAAGVRVRFCGGRVVASPNLTFTITPPGGFGAPLTKPSCFIAGLLQTARCPETWKTQTDRVAETASSSAPVGWRRSTSSESS